MQDNKFSKIREFIESIPDEVCGGNQPEFLFNLSLKLKGKGEIVEIGTNVGKSLIALAYGQKITNGIPVTSIDIYEHHKIVENLQNAGVEDYANRIVLSSALIAKTWSKPVELLWIDGDHSYLGVCTDIKNWVKHVIVGGYVVFHDYPGHLQSRVVSRALNKYIYKNPHQYKVISDRDAGSIIVFQKLSEKSGGSSFSQYLFWKKRDLRTILVGIFPKTARKIKEKK